MAEIWEDVVTEIDKRLDDVVGMAKPVAFGQKAHTVEPDPEYAKLTADRSRAIEHSRATGVVLASEPGRCDECGEVVPCPAIRELQTKYL
jgi:hypothetical protein